MKSLCTTSRFLSSLIIMLIVVGMGPSVPAELATSTVTTTAHLRIPQGVVIPGRNEVIQFADAEALFRVSFDSETGTAVEVASNLHSSGKGQVSQQTYDFVAGGRVALGTVNLPLTEFVLRCAGQLSIPSTNERQPVLVILTLTVNRRGEVNAVIRELKVQRQ
jgi:hypothetical protein